MTMLDDVIADIQIGIYSHAYAPTAPKISAIQGPHRWNEITLSDFGPEHDFELEDHLTTVIFDPISDAALQWCYAHLPEDCPRFGTRGFIIESEHIKGVVGGACRDGLMSVLDYVTAMEENHNAMQQGEEQ